MSKSGFFFLSQPSVPKVSVRGSAFVQLFSKRKPLDTDSDSSNLAQYHSLPAQSVGEMVYGTFITSSFLPFNCCVQNF